jgi:two-component system, OmpR family, KDP operon response regulator KdpE
MTGTDVLVADLGELEPRTVEVLRDIRSRSELPIIVFTTCRSGAVKAVALDAGADDCLDEPFCMEEALARIRVLLRRGLGPVSHGVLRLGGLQIDLGRRRVHLSERLLHLTPTEFRLLEVLVANPGRVLRHRWLLQRVWGGRFGADVTYLRVYIGQLRRKLADDSERPLWIETIPSVGYMWLVDANAHGDARSARPSRRVPA